MIWMKNLTAICEGVAEVTKKDYELFANAIHNRYLAVYSSTDAISLQNMIDLCLEVFKQDNPLFQSDKFEQACYEGKHIRKSIKGDK